MTADRSVIRLLRAESIDSQSPLSTLLLQRSLELWDAEGVGAAGYSTQLHTERWSEPSIRQLGLSGQYCLDPSRA